MGERFTRECKEGWSETAILIAFLGIFFLLAGCFIIPSDMDVITGIISIVICIMVSGAFICFFAVGNYLGVLDAPGLQIMYKLPKKGGLWQVNGVSLKGKKVETHNIHGELWPYLTGAKYIEEYHYPLQGSHQLTIYSGDVEGTHCPRALILIDNTIVMCNDTIYRDMLNRALQG